MLKNSDLSSLQILSIKGCQIQFSKSFLNNRCCKLIYVTCFYTIFDLMKQNQFVYNLFTDYFCKLFWIDLLWLPYLVRECIKRSPIFFLIRQKGSRVEDFFLSTNKKKRIALGYHYCTLFSTRRCKRPSEDDFYQTWFYLAP